MRRSGCLRRLGIRCPRRLLAATAALGITWSSTVRAEPVPVGSPSSNGAEKESDAEKSGKESFEIGRAAYARGDYEAAAEAFEQSYTTSHAPRLLFNTAQALRLAGKCERALGFYQRYRETGMELPSDFAKLELLARRCAEKQSKDQPGSGETAESSRHPSTLATEPAPSPPRATVRARGPRPADSRVRTATDLEAGWDWSRWVGVSCLATAAGSGTAGAVMALRAKAASDRTAHRSETGGVWDAGAQANEQMGKAAATWAIGLFATAALIGGVGSWLVFRPKEPIPATVTVSASPDRLSVQWRESF